MNHHFNKIKGDISRFHSDLDVVSSSFRDFQYRLITISGTTFSIYFALKEHSASVEIKYGFIFLILSMIFGLFSIIFNHIEKAGINTLSLFNIFRFIYKNLNDFSAEEKKELSIQKRITALKDVFIKLDEKGINIHKLYFRTTVFLLKISGFGSVLFSTAQIVMFITGTILLLTHL